MEANTQAGAEAAAASLAANLLPHGYDFLTLDSGWFGEDNLYGTQSVDAYGRLVPNTTQFPDSANGAGFAPLAKKVHAHGLKFGSECEPTLGALRGSL
jgi:alpha-galactosidase